jgi:hypothetical protein
MALGFGFSVDAGLGNCATLLPLQALDEDQEGPNVLIKKLFEEDREFNQGG